MIIVLLRAGADADYREPDDDWVSPKTGDVVPAQTVLTAAAENGYFEVVRILLEHGADPLKPRHDGQTGKCQLRLQRRLVTGTSPR